MNGHEERTGLILHTGRVNDEASFLRRKKLAGMAAPLNATRPELVAAQISYLIHPERSTELHSHWQADSQRLDAGLRYLSGAGMPVHRPQPSATDGQHSAASGLRWGVSELTVIRFQAELVYTHGTGVNGSSELLAGFEGISVPPVKATSMSMRVGMDLHF